MMPDTAMIYVVLLLITISSIERVNGVNEGSSHPTTSLSGCKGTESALLYTINASTSFNLSNIVVNCLAYSDSTTILSGSLSYRDTNGSDGRYFVECVNGLLIVKESSEDYNNTRLSCYQCEDASNPCVAGTECADGCMTCSNNSSCVMCRYALHNGTCLNECPDGRQADPHDRNICKCPNNFGGENCDTCDHECPSTYYLNTTTCICQSESVEVRHSLCVSVGCPVGWVQVLRNPNSTVPESVIGSPGTYTHSEEGTSHHRKRATEPAHHSNESVSEPTTCARVCPDGWLKDSSNVCYACGITYCLECHSNDCEVCRDGTLVNESSHYCAGFYDVMRDLRHELDEEEQHEREVREQEQLELSVILPIACVLAVVVYVLMAVIAHFRYPHVGHDKRHRDPKKKVNTESIEQKFRPKSNANFL